MEIAARGHALEHRGGGATVAPVVEPGPHGNLVVGRRGQLIIVFAVIDGELHTPELDGAILPGITRDSLLVLARSLNYDRFEVVTTWTFKLQHHIQYTVGCHTTSGRTWYGFTNQISISVTYMYLVKLLVLSNHFMHTAFISLHAHG